MTRQQDKKHAWLGWLGHILARRSMRHSRQSWYRRHISASVLLLLLVFLVIGYFVLTDDERVREQTVRALEYVTGGDVELDQASLVVLRHIRIKGLKVFLPGLPHNENNLVLAAEDVILHYQLASLPRRRLQLIDIVAHGARLRILYDCDKGVTNLQQLSIVDTRHATKSATKIFLRKALLEYCEVTKGIQSPVAKQNISGCIYTQQSNSNIYHFQFSSDSEGILRGSSLEGTYNRQKNTLNTKGFIPLETLDFTHLPRRIAKWQELYNISQPTGDIVTHSTYDPTKGHIVTLTVRDGAFNLPIPELELQLQKVNATFVCTNDQITIEQLSAKYADHCQFTANGTIQGYNPQAAFDIYAEIRGLNIPRRQWEHIVSEKQAHAISLRYSDRGGLEPLSSLKQLFDISPQPIQCSIADYGPTGLIDLNLKLSRDEQSQKSLPSHNADIKYRIELIAKGASFTHVKFPYTLTDVTGKIVFEPDYINFGPLVASNDESKTYIVGYWKGIDGADKYDVTFQAQDLKLNQCLYHALNDSEKDIWDSLQPTGSIHALYTIKALPNREPNEKLVVEPLNNSIIYEHFPVPLTDIIGLVNWDPCHVDFDVKYAKVNNGTATLTGKLSDLKEDNINYQIDIDFKNISFDKEFTKALPRESQQFVNDNQISGQISGSARITDKPPGTQIDSTVPPIDILAEIVLSKGYINPKQFPYQLQNVTAKALLDNQLLRIESLESQNGEGSINLHGEFRDDDGFDLHINADRFVITDELPGAIGSRNPWQGKIQTTGSVNLAIDVTKQGHRSDIDYIATIEPLNCQVLITEHDFILPNVTGQIVVTPQTIDIKELISSNAQAVLKASGSLTNIIADANEPSVAAASDTVTIHAERWPVDHQLCRVFPKPIQKLYQKLDPNGLLELDIEVTRKQKVPEASIWGFQGSAALMDSAVKLPLPTDQINAMLTGKARYDEQTKIFDLAAELDAEHMRVKKRPVTNLTAKVTFAGEKSQLDITDISSDFCGGRLAGRIKASIITDEYIDADIVHTQDTTTPPPTAFPYEIELLFDDLDLCQALNRQDKEKQCEIKNLKGRVDGWFSASQSREQENRSGRFQFVIKEAILGELPIPAQLLHVLNFSLPKEGAFHQAHISGYLAQGKTRFDEIRMQGSAMSLTGVGEMTTPDDQLELVFTVDSPQYLQNVPIISSFLKAVKPSLAQLRVTGTFEKPHVEHLAFPDIDEALKELTNKSK